MAFQRHVVKRSGSIAIDADMAHYKTDLVAILATGIGLYVSGKLDQPLIDSGVAGLVALYLIHGAWEVGRGSLNVLMDRELPDEERTRIRGIALSHPEVRSVHELRTRSAGLTKFIQLHIVVDPTMPLGNAHVIGDRVEVMLHEAFPQAEIILHVDGWDDRQPRARCALMGRQPSFVVEDQSAVIAFLEAHLAPQKRIDTHGAVVFLTGERAYKLKRAVKFPYMDFSTAARRAAMCAAEIEINRQLAPEIYLGMAAVTARCRRHTRAGRRWRAAAADAVDWLVVMRRFDEDGHARPHGRPRRADARPDGGTRRARRRLP